MICNYKRHRRTYLFNKAFVIYCMLSYIILLHLTTCNVYIVLEIKDGILSYLILYTYKKYNNYTDLMIHRKSSFLPSTSYILIMLHNVPWHRCGVGGSCSQAGPSLLLSQMEHSMEQSTVNKHTRSSVLLILSSQMKN